MMLGLLLSGCANVKTVGSSGVCDSLSPLIDNHVEGLLKDGGPKSILTGRDLVVGFDKGCFNA